MKIFGKEIRIGSAVMSFVNGTSDLLFKTHRTALAELESSSFISNAGTDSLPVVGNKETLGKWGDFVSSIARRDSIIFKDKDGKPAIPPSLAKIMDQAAQLLAKKSEEMHEIQEHLAAIKTHPDVIVARELVVRSVELVAKKKKNYVQFNPTVFNNHYAPLHAMAAEVNAAYLSAFPSADKATATQPIQKAAMADIEEFLKNPIYSLPDAYAGIDRILRAFQKVNLPEVHSSCRLVRATMLDRAIADGNMGLAIVVLKDAEAQLRQQHGLTADDKLNSQSAGAVEALQAKFLAASKKMRVYAKIGDEKSAVDSLAAELRQLNTRMEISKTNHGSDAAAADTKGRLFDLADTLGDKKLMGNLTQSLAELVQLDPQNVSASAKLKACLEVCAKKGIEVHLPESEPKLGPDTKPAIEKVETGDTKAISAPAGPGLIDDTAAASAAPTVEAPQATSGREVVAVIVGAVIAARTAEKQASPEPGVASPPASQLPALELWTDQEKIRVELNKNAVGTAGYSNALASLEQAVTDSHQVFPDLSNVVKTEMARMKDSPIPVAADDKIHLARAAGITLLRMNNKAGVKYGALPGDKMLRGCLSLGMTDDQLRMAFDLNIQQHAQSTGQNLRQATEAFNLVLTGAKQPPRVKLPSTVLVEVGNAGNTGH